MTGDSHCRAGSESVRDLVARLRWPGIHGSKDHPVSAKLRVEAADRIEGLECDLKTMMDVYSDASIAIGRKGTEEESLADQIIALKGRVEKLTKALLWYADEGHDNGKRARMALSVSLEDRK